jgi:hypothetical protein
LLRLYFKPVITVIVSFLLLNEKVTLASVLGGVIILRGIWLFNRPKPAGKSRNDGVEQISSRVIDFLSITTDQHLSNLAVIRPPVSFNLLLFLASFKPAISRGG